MIEVELKYKLKEFPKVSFPLLEEKKEEDIYYDTEDYNLLKKGNFLRIRNNEKIDFKLSTNDLTHLYCQETRFSLDPFPSSKIQQVFEKLNLEVPCQNREELTKSLKVLAPIIKRRRTYKIDDSITMVLDEIDNLGCFLEIEFDVEKESITEEEGKNYKERLLKILEENHLINDKDERVTIGYVELYLKKYNIDAYYLGLYQ